jgi:hypothetical protein
MAGMSGTVPVFRFSFIEYSKGAREKKRRDVTIEDAERSDAQTKSDPEPEIEIGKEIISRDGFFPTEVRTPARKDPTRDFKMRVKFSAERAGFFPTFIPGNTRKPELSGNGTRMLVLELEDGEEGILCVLEQIKDGELLFTILDLWDPIYITSFSAKSAEEILKHFSGSRRFAGPVKNFFWVEFREMERTEEAERKRAEEEQRRAEEERKLAERQERKKGLIGQIKSLIRGG